MILNKVDKEKLLPDSNKNFSVSPQFTSKVLRSQFKTDKTSEMSRQRIPNATQ